MQEIQPKIEPIAARTRSHTFTKKYTTLSHVAHAVLDHDTGKQLNYGQLRKHSKFQKHGTNLSQIKWEDYARE